MWKFLKHGPKGQKQTLLGFLALGILFLLLLVGKGLETLYSLNQVTSPELLVKKNYSLDKTSALNILYVNFKAASKDSISVISFQQKDQQAVVMHISDQIYLNVPKEYGMWTVGSVYKLGQEDNPQRGGQLLTLSVSKLLGLPIDGVVISKAKVPQTAEEFIADLRKNPLSTLLNLNNFQSSLTKVESFNLFRSLSGIRADKVVSLDLAKSAITDSKLLPDSSRVLGVDSGKLDAYIRDKMGDSAILEESLSIAVFNATDHPGLATEAARIITNMGGNVVITSSTTVLLDRGVIVLSPDSGISEKSQTKKRLAQIFAPQCLKTACSSTDYKIINSRAQINVIIGEDFYNLWHKR